MASKTIVTPSIGTNAFFTFKEPFNGYIKSKFNLFDVTIKARVISVASMQDLIRLSRVDPFTDIYDPAGLSTTEYSQDLLDEIEVITFEHKDINGYDHLFRVPANYVDSVSDPNTVEYGSRVLVVDLGPLPAELDLTPLYDDLVDHIATRTGVKGDMRDVSTGDFYLLPFEEHVERETIRSNNVEVNKTLSVMYAELSIAHNALLERLDEMGIVLGD